MKTSLSICALLAALVVGCGPDFDPGETLMRKNSGPECLVMPDAGQPDAGQPVVPEVSDEQQAKER